MAITRNHLLTAMDGSDLTDYVTASITPTANRLLIACYTTSRNDSTNPDTPGVTQSSGTLTLTEIASYLFTTSGTARRKMWIFAADTGGSPGGGAVVFDHATGPHLRAGWSIFELNGTDVAAGVVQCFVQTPTAGADASASSVSVGLSAAGATDNRPFSFLAQVGLDAVTPRTNWTEIGEAGSGEVLIVETQERLDTFETTASASWASSLAHGFMAFEVKAAAAGGGTVMRRALLGVGV